MEFITPELINKGIKYLENKNLINKCIEYKFTENDIRENKIYCFDEFELIKDNIEDNIDIKFGLNDIIQSCSCYGLAVYIYHLLQHIKNYYNK